MNQRNTLLTAAVLGFVAVAIGAFGAHAFKPTLIATGRLDTYELAVRYQFYHTFALLAVGMLMSHFDSKKLYWASLFFFLGILLFCGSLYVLCMTGIGVLGAVTPLGGVLFLLGWAFLLLGVAKRK
ncbi:DUF423 domain-containing protein [Chryseolinea lacunae]|uniref:DUF423 domain-containing protein n=1 Tax=Chryseolinea lacunae TaxID=2801331 RepID=A0ABS1KU47_9BACT|nr:DUF423 domain-containing protein [Chryseolinea lacunae]MBL0742929.1 DUF423 domain-containing protein [Chryseolinea lacunae]